MAVSRPRMGSATLRGRPPHAGTARARPQRPRPGPRVRESFDTGVPKINVTLDFQATFILPQPLKVKCALKNRLYLKMVGASSNEGGSV